MKTITTLIAVVLFVAMASTADAGLLASWRFENNLNDSSGNGRTLRPNPKTYDTGLIGQALDMDGIGPNTVEQGTDPGAIDDNAFDFGSGDFTISLWALFNDLSGEQNLIEKFQQPSGPGWTLYKKGGPADQIEWYGAGVGAVTGNTIGISAGTWHHIVLRRDATNIELIIDTAQDGASLAHGGAAISDSPNALGIGFRRGGANFMNGSIDEVTVWDEALSNVQIAALYNNGDGVITIPEPASLLLIALGSLAVLVRRTRAIT